jgi:hypothetical protein
MLHWRLTDNSVDQIRPKKGFATIERESRVRIFLQETIKQVKTDIQFRWKMGIDFDLWRIFLLTSFRIIKRPGPAVAAAEIAVVGEDEMEIQENPLYYET